MLLDLCIDALPTHPTLTHPKTGEPLRAVGVRRNGDPIWPVMGAAPDDEDDDKGGDGGGDDDSGDDGDDDGDEGDQEDDEDGKGKKDEPDTNSVDYWKTRSRQNERRAKKAEREAARAKKQPDTKAKSKPKGKDSDDEPDADEIREQAREEARQEALSERVSDKIEAKARKFADPEDAALMLLRSHDIDDFLDGDGKKVDVEAINEALDELLEKKPYLAADNGKRFKGGGDGGARQSKKARPKSIGEAVSNRYKK